MNSALKALTTLASSSVVAMALASESNAATMVQMFDYDIPETATPFPEPFDFTLPGFDSALGMLTGITIQTTVNSTGIVSIFNATGTNQDFINATSAVTLTVTAPTTTINTTATAIEPSGTVIPGQNDFPGQMGTQVSNTIIEPGDFGAYIGGMLNLSFMANALAGSYSGTAPSGVFFGGSANVGGNVAIIYTYEVEDNVPGNPPRTPEPGTIAGLLAIGATGLASRRRKS
ncbi:hypothetical protein cce_3478 [Crocosphaera subtropica ATCC 51142]|uniref:PEP-CTERM protein-sorting domain-containing protein n=1 Tax=Crocosphaera subtropica (strain ATCC 51142 / BH68) TaxID=43989 RepID=B1WZS7_CROS5|nr:PEP-CTERM sorting domain-containing protein [Crocosphaera subtropica]ACB52826.1 hypothetical protein cce_3478 [Crocosphaera subtropica ATCC 51142]